MTLSFRTKVIAGIALAIAFVVLGFCERRAGKQIGALSQKMVASAARVKSIEVAVAEADKAASVETKKLVTKNADYQTARAKIEVKGDAITSDGQTAVMPSVAAALERADSLSAQVTPTLVKQARSDSLQNVLVGALSHHVDLLQEQKSPRCGKKCGIAIGVAATVGTVYVVVKIVGAIAKAHK